MQSLTRALNVLFGVISAGTGLVAVVAPAPVLPAEELTPLATHLARDEGGGLLLVRAALRRQGPGNSS